MVVGCVPPVAVRGLDDDRVSLRRVIGGRNSGWWARPRSPLNRTRAAVGLHQSGGRAQDVARSAQGDRRAVRERDALAIPNRLEERQHALHVAGVVQRQGGVMFGEADLVGVRRVLLLQVSAVAQHDLGQLRGLARAQHSAAEALTDQSRQVARVVQVRVGEDNGVERRGVAPAAAPSCAAAGRRGPGRGPHRPGDWCRPPSTRNRLPVTLPAAPRKLRTGLRLMDGHPSDPAKRSSSSRTRRVVASTLSGLRLIESMPISTRNSAISG